MGSPSSSRGSDSLVQHHTQPRVCCCATAVWFAGSRLKGKPRFQHVRNSDRPSSADCMQPSIQRPHGLWGRFRNIILSEFERDRQMHPLVFYGRRPRGSESSWDLSLSRGNSWLGPLHAASVKTEFVGVFPAEIWLLTAAGDGRQFRVRARRHRRERNSARRSRGTDILQLTAGRGLKFSSADTPRSDYRSWFKRWPTPKRKLFFSVRKLRQHPQMEVLCCC